jgi:hypothetical protein
MIQRERDRLKLALKHLDEDHDATGRLLNAQAIETRASLVRRIAECDTLLGQDGDP